YRQHLLHQHFIPGKYGYPATDGKFVLISNQFYTDEVVTQTLRVVSVNAGLVVHIIHHQVKVTIVVEIRIGCSVRDGGLVKTPVARYIGKRQIAVTAK